MSSNTLHASSLLEQIGRRTHTWRRHADAHSLRPFRTSSSSVCTHALLHTPYSSYIHFRQHTQRRRARMHLSRCIFKQPLQRLAALEAPLVVNTWGNPHASRLVHGAWCMMGQPQLFWGTQQVPPSVSGAHTKRQHSIVPNDKHAFRHGHRMKCKHRHLCTHPLSQHFYLPSLRSTYLRSIHKLDI